MVDRHRDSTTIMATGITEIFSPLIPSSLFGHFVCEHMSCSRNLSPLQFVPLHLSHFDRVGPSHHCTGAGPYRVSPHIFLFFDDIAPSTMYQSLSLRPLWTTFVFFTFFVRSRFYTDFTPKSCAVFHAVSSSSQSLVHLTTSMPTNHCFLFFIHWNCLLSTHCDSSVFFRHVVPPIILTRDLYCFLHRVSVLVLEWELPHFMRLLQIVCYCSLSRCRARKCVDIGEPLCIFLLSVRARLRAMMHLLCVG